MWSDTAKDLLKSIFPNASRPEKGAEPHPVVMIINTVNITMNTPPPPVDEHDQSEIIP